MELPLQVQVSPHCVALAETQLSVASLEGHLHNESAIVLSPCGLCEVILTITFLNRQVLPFVDGIQLLELSDQLIGFYIQTYVSSDEVALCLIDRARHHPAKD